MSITDEQQKDLENTAETPVSEPIVETGEEALPDSVGNYLKVRREARGISLKTVSKDTKIALSKLEFLEKDDFENLPNRIYVEGYIKSYAKSIGIDSCDCLKILCSTYKKSSLRRHLPLQDIPKEHQEKRKRSSYAKMAFAIPGVLFIALLVWLLNSKYKNDSPSYSTVSMPPPQVKLKSVDTETSFKMTPNKIVVESAQPSVKNSEDREVAGVESSALVKEIVPEEKKVDEGEDKKKMDFFPMNRILYSFNTSIRPEFLSKMIPEDIQRSVVADKQSIYIKANRGDSWLSYKADDKPARSITIKEGKDLFIRGGEVRVFFANIRAVDVFLNNRLLTIESSTGLKSIVFPQENRSKYVRPLFIYRSGKIETSDEYLSRQEKEKEKENI